MSASLTGVCASIGGSISSIYATLCQLPKETDWPWESTGFSGDHLRHDTSHVVPTFFWALPSGTVASKIAEYLCKASPKIWSCCQPSQVAIRKQETRKKHLETIYETVSTTPLVPWKLKIGETSKSLAKRTLWNRNHLSIFGTLAPSLSFSLPSLVPLQGQQIRIRMVVSTSKLFQ